MIGLEVFSAVVVECFMIHILFKKLFHAVYAASYSFSSPRSFLCRALGARGR